MTRVPAGALLNLTRGAYGGVLLAAPRTMATAYTGRRQPRPMDVLLVRVLGARQLVQALGCSGRADRAAFQIGAEVDLGHAASTVAAAVLSAPLRRAALIDTAVAAGFAAGGILAARRWRGGTPLSGPLGAACRWRDRAAAALVLPRRASARRG